MSNTAATDTLRAPRRRIHVLTVLLLVVALGAGTYLYFFLWRPMGTGPAGPPVPLTAFEAPWSDTPTVLLGLGDSITTGFGARQGYNYFDRLVANPPDEFDDMAGRNLSRVMNIIEARNVSVNGSTSIDCAEKVLPVLKPYPPEVQGVVVITTGGNDLIHMYGRIPPREGAMYGATLAQAQPWIANYQARLDDIVQKTNALFPGGCQIFLGTIYDPSDGIGDATEAGLPAWPEMLSVLGAYNDSIRACAQQHANVHLVDIHATFLGHGVACHRFWNPHYDAADPHYWYYTNLEDPNERGYDAIRRIYLLKMAEVLR